jgi:drug/metabolite transporter (DMT)-like permease
MKATPRTNATLAAIGSILLWCWSAVCFRKGAEAIGAMPYLALMTATGVTTVVVVQLCQRRALADLVRIPRRVMVAGFFGVAFYTVMLAEALAIAEESDVGQVALLNYMWPIWVVAIGAVLLDDKPRTVPLIVGLALGFGGVAVSRGMATFSRSPSDLTPHAMALAGGILWALYSVLLRRWRVPEEKGGTAFHFAVCSAMAASIAAVRGQWGQLEDMTPSAVGWVLFGGIGPVGLGYYMWEIGVKRGAVNLIATLAYFIPILSAILIGLFFREALSWWLLWGALMIVAGAWLVNGATRTSAMDQ